MFEQAPQVFSVSERWTFPRLWKDGGRDTGAHAFLLTSVRRKLSWKGVFMVTREQKSKNMMQRNLFTKTEIDSWMWKTNLWLPKGKGEEG